jgi:hypothetical protein
MPELITNVIRETFLEKRNQIYILLYLLSLRYFSNNSILCSKSSANIKIIVSLFLQNMK